MAEVLTHKPTSAIGGMLTLPSVGSVAGKMKAFRSCDHRNAFR